MIMSISTESYLGKPKRADDRGQGIQANMGTCTEGCSANGYAGYISMVQRPAARVWLTSLTLSGRVPTCGSSATQRVALRERRKPRANERHAVRCCDELGCCSGRNYLQDPLNRWRYLGVHENDP